jgi:hypothetical protein
VTVGGRWSAGDWHVGVGVGGGHCCWLCSWCLCLSRALGRLGLNYDTKFGDL